MNGKTISVIVPAYNIAPWISRSLDSLLAQTHKDLEIIVVDDGSSDGTEALFAKWMEEGNDFPIRYVRQENGGKCRREDVGNGKIHGPDAQSGA